MEICILESLWNCFCSVLPGDSSILGLSELSCVDLFPYGCFSKIESGIANCCLGGSVWDPLGEGSDYYSPLCCSILTST